MAIIDGITDRKVTFKVDDAIWREARKWAIDHGVSYSQMINAALAKLIVEANGVSLKRQGRRRRG